MPEPRDGSRISQERLAFWVTGCLVSAWPIFALDYVNVAQVSDGLLVAFPILAGFLAVALSLQRDTGWLHRQSWRRVSIERRMASRSLDRLVLVLFGYIATFVIMLGVRAFATEGSISDALTRVYLSCATITLYGTLFLPFEIRRMRMKPHGMLSKRR